MAHKRILANIAETKPPDDLEPKNFAAVLPLKPNPLPAEYSKRREHEESTSRVLEPDL